MMKLLDKIVLTAITLIVIPLSSLTGLLCYSAFQIIGGADETEDDWLEKAMTVSAAMSMHPIKFLKAVWTED